MVAIVDPGGGLATLSCDSISALARSKAAHSSCPIALQLRMDERRSIGRELHDSTAQLLVALQLNFARLKRQLGIESDGLGVFVEIDHLLADLHREVRSVAATAPKAPLRSRNLVSAITDMTENFSRLTGVKVTVKVRGQVVGISGAVGTALYRIAQETIANAARHGRARHVSIVIKTDGSGAAMVIEDDAIGIGSNSTAGMGLNSIRERVDELGGLLSIQRLDRGTRVSVSLCTRKISSRPVKGGGE